MSKSKTPKPKKTAKKPAIVEKAVSNKTPQVMRLVERDAEVNPAILAGKSTVPRQLRGREPLSKIMKRDYPSTYFENDDAEVVNISELAIKLEAPEILDRFNACSCSKCVAIFTEKVSQKVQPRFARIARGGNMSSNSARMSELYGRVEQMRKVVLPEMIREIIGKKKRWFHDE